MKILYFFKEDNTIMYQWQRHHIFSELLTHGIEIEVFNPLLFQTKETANSCLLSKIKKTGYDLFMTPHNEEDLYIDTLKQIKCFGIPTLLICFDNLIIPFFHKKICSYFDLVWLTSRETEKYFHRWKATTITLPYAASPIGSVPPRGKEIERITFVGSPYGSRVNTINKLLEAEIDIDIYGNLQSGVDSNAASKKYLDMLSSGVNLALFPIGRKIILGALKQKIVEHPCLRVEHPYFHVCGSAELDDLGKIYSTYALSLSSTSARNTGVLKKSVGIINLRSFEIPMSYGIQICPFFEELSEYFRDEEEIIFYHSAEELVDKVKFYLDANRAHKRAQIKNAAHKRAEAEHTWFCRFSKIFEQMGIECKG